MPITTADLDCERQTLGQLRLALLKAAAHMPRTPQTGAIVARIACRLEDALDEVMYIRQSALFAEAVQRFWPAKPQPASFVLSQLGTKRAAPEKALNNLLRVFWDKATQRSHSTSFCFAVADALADIFELMEVFGHPRLASGWSRYSDLKNRSVD